VKTVAAITAVLLVAIAMPIVAQDQKPAVPAPNATMKVQLVLSRYQGEKKISSLPYTLTVSTDERRSNTGRAGLRLGAQVPITTMVREGSDEKARLVPSVQYRDVGTNIDCLVNALDDGRFRLELTIEDSSVDTSPATNTTHPAFKSFRTNDQMILRDGQSAQYSTATDKLSGEVWKVDVTVNVVK